MKDDKPNAEGKTAFIGFNDDGQVVFDFYNTITAPSIIIGNTISAKTIRTAVNPSTTYIQLVKIPPPYTPPTATGRIGIEIYRNGVKYYEKYITLSKTVYPGTYLLVNGGSATNPWTITKNGISILSANTTVGGSVFENRLAI